jgi:colanic acid biosynthesis glycosyl transferase WcaI
VEILIVSQYFWPEKFRISDLASGLVELGHSVSVLTGVPNYPDGKVFDGYGWFKSRRQQFNGVTVIRVPLVPRGRGRGLRLAFNYLSFAIMATLFAPFLCRRRYDVIFICQLSPASAALPGVFFGRLRRVPIILWILDLWPESLSATGAVKSKRLLSGVDWMVRAIYRRCDLVAVSSRGFGSSVRARGVPADRIVDLPNWYEPEYARVPSVLSLDEVSSLPKGFLVMFAGNVGAAQSFETILEAAEKLKATEDIHWVIIGNGRRFEWVSEEVERRGLRAQVHLLGRRAPEAMPAYFEKADVMLVTLRPDPVFALTVPGKIQSYMACGRPIVGALDGEAGRLIEESGAGLVCPAGDAEGLAASVLRLFQMPRANRDRMGAEGKRYCEQHFDRGMLLGRLERWIAELSSLRQAS